MQELIDKLRAEFPGCYVTLSFSPFSETHEGYRFSNLKVLVNKTNEKYKISFGVDCELKTLDQAITKLKEIINGA